MNGAQYCIYGDQAYVIRPEMQTVYPTALATDGYLSFNTSMHAVRIAVELNCKDFKQKLASQEFHRKLYEGKLPAVSMYIEAVLLSKFNTCLGGVCQPISYFLRSPTVLDRYLSCSE